MVNYTILNRYSSFNTYSSSTAFVLCTMLVMEYTETIYRWHFEICTGTWLIANTIKKTLKIIRWTQTLPSKYRLCIPASNLWKLCWVNLEMQFIFSWFVVQKLWLPQGEDYHLLWIWDASAGDFSVSCTPNWLLHLVNVMAGLPLFLFHHNPIR